MAFLLPAKLFARLKYHGSRAKKVKNQGPAALKKRQDERADSGHKIMESMTHFIFMLS